MQKDKRKSRRQPLRYGAWMALDNEKLHGCVLSDISDTGARLDVEEFRGHAGPFPAAAVGLRIGAP